MNRGNLQQLCLQHACMEPPGLQELTKVTFPWPGGSCARAKSDAARTPASLPRRGRGADGNIQTLLPALSCWCLAGNGWEWGNGTIINNYGSFPPSLQAPASCGKLTLICHFIPQRVAGGSWRPCGAACRASCPCACCAWPSSISNLCMSAQGPPGSCTCDKQRNDSKVNKMERVVHNPVDLVVEVPRPVVIEKTIEVLRWHGTSTLRLEA